MTPNIYKDAKPQIALKGGKYEEHCPQNIAIIEELKNTRAALE